MNIGNTSLMTVVLYSKCILKARLAVMKIGTGLFNESSCTHLNDNFLFIDFFTINLHAKYISRYFNKNYHQKRRTKKCEILTEVVSHSLLRTVFTRFPELY